MIVLTQRARYDINPRLPFPCHRSAKKAFLLLYFLMCARTVFLCKKRILARGAGVLEIKHIAINRNRVSTVLQGGICRLKNGDDPQPTRAVRSRLFAIADAFDKVLTHLLEGLCLFQARTVNISVSVGEVKVTKAFIM